VAGELFDAHVLAVGFTFPKGQPPAWVVFPDRRAESEVAGGQGSGPGAVSGPRAVLSEPGEGSEADIPKSGRVLRVRCCSGCGTWYGACYPEATVAEGAVAC
jgi:hypothetical protein